MHTINEVKEFMTPENAEDLLTNAQVINLGSLNNNIYHLIKFYFKISRDIIFYLKQSFDIHLYA